jgi:transcriptional regulator with XRE-family HTH domain
VKLGDVLRKEREKKGRPAEEIASRLGIGVNDYDQIERGESVAERWAPILASLAIELETPTSRLLAASGRPEDTRPGQAGPLISEHRRRLAKSTKELAEGLGLTLEEYEEIEAGHSPLEQVGPLLLNFAAAIDQPVFNLLYPCGLPFQELDDYP